MLMISNDDGDCHVKMKIAYPVEDPTSATQLEVVSSHFDELAALGVEPREKPNVSILFPCCVILCEIIIYY